MFFGRPWRDWIAQYQTSHQHPLNARCHMIGIPMIILSLVLLPLAAVIGGFWKLPAALFLVGWIFQFIGHWIEGKPPEFFKDWRFLLVGARWWAAKVTGRI